MSLPQVYASDAELAATDELRDTNRRLEHAAAATAQRTLTPQQQQQQQRYSPSSSQQQQQQFHSTLPLANTQSYYSGSARHVQAPQRGISSIPKDVQPSWQHVASKGAFQYQGNTFQATMSAHLPTQLSSKHAEGPQHLENVESLSALPDAPHRQAWTTQPTYRWFKRSDYEGVPDRWSGREGPFGRGDNTYRPLSVKEQQAINERVERRKALKGAPRTGEW